jgi:murein DD-endopeptidase MepM/ murein hydrolase activator NlpD
MKIRPLNIIFSEDTASEIMSLKKTDYKKVKIPQKGEAGSFWEDRGDRFHCGVDLYAPENTEVVSIEKGVVAETGVMTSPEILPYWNPTYYVIIEHERGLFCKYGELAGFTVREGDEIEPGRLIGYVGMVLNSSKIDESCPLYIRKLKDKNPSMLHFELWKKLPVATHRNYLGGNWFGEEKPENLVDPTGYLEQLLS